MGGFLPSELTTLISLIESTTGPIATALTAFKAFIIEPPVGIPSPDIASALIEAVENFRDDFLGAGFYALDVWEYPLKQYYRTGITGEQFNLSFEQDVIASFTDVNDPNVPPFSSDAAMLVLVGGLPGLSDVASSLTSFAAGFPSWKSVSEAADKVAALSWKSEIDSVVGSIKDGTIEFGGRVADQTKKLLDVKQMGFDALNNLTPSELAAISVTNITTAEDVNNLVAAVQARVASSTYPDWQSITLSKLVPPLPDLVNQVFDPLIEGLKKGRGILEVIQAIIETLTYKIDQLDAVIIRIDTYLDQLEILVGLTGLYSLYIETDEGIGGLALALEEATNPPFGSEDAFYFGTVLVAGGPSLQPFKNLFGSI